MIGREREARVAVSALVAHGALLLFSGLAFATFLAPPAPAWLLTPSNQRVAAFMFTFGGQITVVLGALAGLFHAASRLGWRSALALFGVGFGVSLAAELTGTTTGYPFGPYSYTTQLGYLIGGRVPFDIPTSWFFMLYASLAICGRLLIARDDSASRWRWAALAAVVLTAWDVSMDPAMVATTHWLWHLPPAQSASLAQRVLLSPSWYGMPLSNWLGWLLTGFVVARLMLAIVPPSQWARRVSTSPLPLVLYAANALLPLLVCAGRGMWWAVLFGMLAMTIPLLLALRAAKFMHATSSSRSRASRDVRGVAGD